MAFNWTCPHCSTTQTVVAEKRDTNTRGIDLKDQAEGHLIIQDNSIGCSNPECLKTTIKVRIAPGKYNGNGSHAFTATHSIFNQQVYHASALLLCSHVSCCNCLASPSLF